MSRTLTYFISEADAACSILDFLKKQGYSRKIITSLKKVPYGVLCNDRWAYVWEPLHAGDHLTIRLPEDSPSEHIPAIALPLNIIYEDEDILVVNKPAGMPIHPSMNHYENTLANAVMWYYESQGISFTFRCVNRLDRDTSGLTIIAKHMLSSHLLSRQVRERNLSREYLAIAEGITPKSGTIDAPIARKANSVLERCIDSEHGEHAVTHYQRLSCTNELSMLSLHLETGRTHQIRVHMASIGHPLIGDFLYNPDNHLMQRQALHSFRLTFFHPITHEKMTFTAPLPDDMRTFFAFPNTI